MCCRHTVEEPFMFQSISFVRQDESANMLIAVEPNYLLFVADGCDESSLISLYPNHRIYSIHIPAIIWEQKAYHDAMLLCELDASTQIAFYTIHDKINAPWLIKSKSAMLFVHWLDPNIYTYLDNLFSITNDDITLVGAGCGTTLSPSAPSLFFNGKPYDKNGFLLLSSHNTMAIGAKHGAHYFNGFYTARMHNSNTIATINGESASVFYTKMIQKLFHETTNNESIFTTGLKYPLGLGTTQEEKPLRVPVAIEGGHLITSGPIEDGSNLSFMQSIVPSFFNAPTLSSLEAKQASTDLAHKECFIIECMGRKEVLGTCFDDEIKHLAKQFNTCQLVYGILSLGEIANRSEKYIEYFNESCVVGVF